jgi:hypothetical protein
MLPADAVGMLNITYEFDASRKHCPASDIKIVDPEEKRENPVRLRIAMERRTQWQR